MSVRGVVFVIFLKQVAIVACSSYYSVFFLLLFIGLIILASANKLVAKYLVDRALGRYILCNRYFYRSLTLLLVALLCLSVYSY
jgi:hypothetical protein